MIVFIEKQKKKNKIVKNNNITETKVIVCIECFWNTLYKLIDTEEKKLLSFRIQRIGSK